MTNPDSVRQGTTRNLQNVASDGLAVRQARIESFNRRATARRAEEVGHTHGAEPRVRFASPPGSYNRQHDEYMDFLRRLRGGTRSRKQKHKKRRKTMRRNKSKKSYVFFNNFFKIK